MRSKPDHILKAPARRLGPSWCSELSGWDDPGVVNVIFQYMINSCLHITYGTVCFLQLQNAFIVLQFPVYQENASDFGYFSLEREIVTRNKQKKKKGFLFHHFHHL